MKLMSEQETTVTLVLVQVQVMVLDVSSPTWLQFSLLTGLSGSMRSIWSVVFVNFIQTTLHISYEKESNLTLLLGWAEYLMSLMRHFRCQKVTK